MIFSSHGGLAYRGLMGRKQTAIFGVFTTIQVGPSWASPHGLNRDPRHRPHRPQEGDICEYGCLSGGAWRSQGKGEQLWVHTHCLLHGGHVFASISLVYLPHPHASFFRWSSQQMMVHRGLQCPLARVRSQQ